MDASAAIDLLDTLDENINDLEAAMQPLLTTSISSTAGSLTPIDQAKLYTWTSYTIESLLFSYIRLNGSDGRSHPVFAELQRIQQYMLKIEKAQNPDYGKRENMSLDKAAAGRFIKAGLAGNEKYDEERAQREQELRANAQKKLEALDIKASNRGDAMDVDGQGDVQDEGSNKKKKNKHTPRKKRSRHSDTSSVATNPQTTSSPKPSKKQKHLEKANAGT